MNNPFFDIPPLSSGRPYGVVPPQIGADFTWNPMAEFLNEPVEATGGTAAATSGAFYGTYTVVDDPTPANDGDIYLQGGSINGLPIATSDLKLYDFVDETWTGDPDDHLYVAVTGAFEVVDGVAMPGFTAATAVAAAPGPLPTSTFPAVDTPTTAADGICYVSLGVFTATGFLPSRSGNRVISLCYTPPYTGDV